MSALTRAEIAQRLEQLTELSVALSTNRDTAQLLERILRTAKTMAHADGGTLYRAAPDGKSLRFHISISDSLNMYQGGVGGDPIDIPDIPLMNANGSKNLDAVAAYAANTGMSVNIQDVYQADEFNFSGMRSFDELYGYHSESFLMVPMQDHEGELIGVLQLINPKDQASGKTCPFTETDQRFIEALPSQAAIAITKQELIALLENLFESFVRSSL